MAGGEGQSKKSDLGVRTLSAVVMVAVAGSALWLGGWFWAMFVGLVACGVLWEWRALVVGFVASPVRRGLWNAAGFAYIAVAAAMLLLLRADAVGMTMLLALVAGVIATDVGAYFAGRAIGGPKIAPRISPSKTWAGLGGGIVGASLAGAGVAWGAASGGAAPSVNWAEVLAFGTILAITAQAGDFFESWMKRRAGVKDSSRLIPGHGGMFDRVDGLLAVLFVAGLTVLIPAGWVLLSGQSLLPSPA